MAAFNLEKLLGPRRYTATTPWKAWQAIGAAIGIWLIATFVASGAVTFILFWIAANGAQETLIGLLEVGLELLATPIVQFVIVGMTYWVASLRLKRPVGQLESKALAPHVLALQSETNSTTAGATSLGCVRSYIVSFAGLVVCLAIYTGITWLIWPEDYFKDLLQYRSAAHSNLIWPFVFIAVIGAPLSEELLFRGFLLPALAQTRLGFVGAAVLTSASWAAMHWGYSAISLGEIFLIGLFFSAVLWRTGSLWVTIVCHGLYNLALIGVLLAIGPGG